MLRHITKLLIYNFVQWDESPNPKYIGRFQNIRFAQGGRGGKATGDKNIDR